MTLDRYRSLADRVLEPFVDLAVTLGVTPNGVSVIAFALAGLAAVGFYLAGGDPIWYLVGAFLVFINGWLDLLDGALARELAVDSDAGDMLDHVLDRYADIVIIAGLAAAVDRYLLGFLAVTGVLMTSYLGTQAQAVGLERAYGGALGRADRLALVVAVGVVAAFVPTVAGISLVVVLLGVFALVGHVTAVQRFWHAWRALE